MINISLATRSDKEQLLSFFKHYQNQRLINYRVDCFLSHNFTVIAKDDQKMVGVLQWSIKEDPKMGVVEFEEVNIIKDYQGQGIGSQLIKFAIESVKNYFSQINLTPRKIFLFVSQENKIAQNLYKKFGFQPVSKVGNLFSESEIEEIYVFKL